MSAGASPGKRREMDVMKLMMSDWKVELVNDNISEFNVLFKGPLESALFLLVATRCQIINMREPSAVATSWSRCFLCSPRADPFHKQTMHCVPSDRPIALPGSLLSLTPLPSDAEACGRGRTVECRAVCREAIDWRITLPAPVTSLLPPAMVAGARRYSCVDLLCEVMSAANS